MRQPGVYTVGAMMAIVLAVGDIRNVLLKGMKRIHRLARHAWRISFGIAWSALAFGERIFRIFDSTIELMPYVAAIPATLTLYIMACRLFGILQRQSGSPAFTTVKRLNRGNTHTRS